MSASSSLDLCLPPEGGNHGEGCRGVWFCQAPPVGPGRYRGAWWTPLTSGPGPSSRPRRWTWGSWCPLRSSEAVSSSPSPHRSGNGPREGLPRARGRPVPGSVTDTHSSLLIPSAARQHAPRRPDEGAAALRGHGWSLLTSRQLREGRVCAHRGRLTPPPSVRLPGPDAAPPRPGRCSSP